MLDALRIHFIITCFFKKLHFRLYFKQAISHFFTPSLFILFFMVHKFSKMMGIA